MSDLEWRVIVLEREVKEIRKMLGDKQYVPGLCELCNNPILSTQRAITVKGIPKYHTDCIKGQL